MISSFAASMCGRSFAGQLHWLPLLKPMCYFIRRPMPTQPLAEKERKKQGNDRIIMHVSLQFQSNQIPAVRNWRSLLRACACDFVLIGIIGAWICP